MTRGPRAGHDNGRRDAVPVSHTLWTPGSKAHCMYTKLREEMEPQPPPQPPKKKRKRRSKSDLAGKGAGKKRSAFSDVYFFAVVAAVSSQSDKHLEPELGTYDLSRFSQTETSRVKILGALVSVLTETYLDFTFTAEVISSVRIIGIEPARRHAIRILTQLLENKELFPSLTLGLSPYPSLSLPPAPPLSARKTSDKVN